MLTSLLDNLDQLDVKLQRLASEWMVGIDSD
jgi:hypothetical protein